MASNPIDKAIEDAVKNLIFDTILKIVIEKIIEKVPFLALPVINPVFTFIMGKIAGLIYEELSKSVSFIVIDLKTGQQVAEYQNSVANLKEKITLKDEAEIAKAKEEFKKKLAALIKFNRVPA